ncbi:DUF2254 domain-containing protein [Sphingomonas arantia]|uniref:DUF2254 domain-containing protein n=1 Tax=Sphingomonas arantia TaxID=1460676 RepID=A0ABW4TWD9_9SPHN
MRLLTRHVWFRAALFCVFAASLALAGAVVGPVLSYDFGTKIGAKSVDNILNVLAASMLTVTTFSLTAMVQAYSGATSSITPRAVQLLIDDTTAQNALSTFLGSFLFAVVGIIALSTDLYGETGRVILYIGTILVILYIVVTLLRWIEHVANFGRVSDTINRVETAALKAVADLTVPLRFHASTTTFPADARPIRCDAIGRVTHIDLSDLAEVAEEIGTVVNVAVSPGALIDPARTIAWLSSDADDRQIRKIADAFTIADNRAFDQDPRFGLVVLAEIAARALSPAVNDPGTAIAVLDAGTRVLAALLRHHPDETNANPARVTIPPLAFRDLIEDLYRPIARDGASMLEVGIRLQKSLLTLTGLEPFARSACEAASADALERAEAALTSDADRNALLRLRHQLWEAPHMPA